MLDVYSNLNNSPPCHAERGMPKGRGGVRGSDDESVGDGTFAERNYVDVHRYEVSEGWSEATAKENTT